MLPQTEAEATRNGRLSMSQSLDVSLDNVCPPDDDERCAESWNEERKALHSQIRSLQFLVVDLLIKNEDLRRHQWRAASTLRVEELLQPLPRQFTPRAAVSADQSTSRVTQEST